MEKQEKKRFHNNIFLIGFMGSGKTTVSDYFSKTYGMEKVEMDSLISKREGMSIPDIFAVHGEAYFRNLETALLTELMEKKGVVVSCGGGTPMRENNVALMKKNGKVVLLSAEPETVYQRVKDSHDRPLLENHKDVSYIRDLMEQRREKYEAAADLIVATDGKDRALICAEILRSLSEGEQSFKYAASSKSGVSSEYAASSKSGVFSEYAASSKSGVSSEYAASSKGGVFSEYAASSKGEASLQ